MKTAIQEVMDEIEMEHNNGVEISQKQLWKMLLKAKKKEEEQITTAYKEGWKNPAKFRQNGSEYYYKNLFGDSNEAGI